MPGRSLLTPVSLSCAIVVALVAGATPALGSDDRCQPSNRGTSGDDCLVGGSGADSLVAGAGDDRVLARDGYRDLIRCGPGRDRATVDAADRTRGCERVNRRRAPGKVTAEAGRAPKQGTDQPPAEPDPPAEDPPAPSPGCAVDAARMVATGCELLRADSAAAESPRAGLWGSLDCASASRHERPVAGGDPSPTATGAGQGNAAYRRLTAIDGDDFYGERCELGRNTWRYGENSGSQSSGTFGLFREGERKITFFSQRYPSGFPLDAGSWQDVMQMKQAQPYTDDGNAGVALELQLQGGTLSLNTRWATRWSAPAPVAGEWIRYALDVVYSDDPEQGSVRLYVDRNADGDWLDAQEQSPPVRTATLVTERRGTSGGIATGEAIPSHLRLGLYHSPGIGCPPPGGCSVEVDNVQIVGS